MDDPPDRRLRPHDGPDFLPPTTGPARPEPAPPVQPFRPTLPPPLGVGPPPTVGPPSLPVGIAHPGTRAPARRRLLVAAVLAAALTGSLSGVASARLTEPASTTDLWSLPRSVGPAPAVPGTASGISEVAAAVLPSVVSVQVRGPGGGGTGSGFVLDDRGRVLTNAHVVGRARQVQVAFADGRQAAADVVGTDPAATSPSCSSRRTPSRRRFGSAAPPRCASATPSSPSDPRWAFPERSPPGSSALPTAGTVTAGIVSATDRDTRLGAGGSRQPAVQTDASINPGNSGGPLVDAAGRVVGVNTSIATLGTGSPGNIGIGFAIPVDRAAAVAEQLISRA